MEHFKRRTVALHPFPRKCRQVRESHSRTVLLGCIWWERRHAGTVARRRGIHLFLLILKCTRTESDLCQKSKWKERNVVLLWNDGHGGDINTWSPLSFPPPTPTPPPHSNKLCSDLPEICLHGLDSSSEDQHLLFYQFSFIYLQTLSCWSARIGKERRHFLPFSLRAVHRLLLFLSLFFAVTAIFVRPPQWSEILLLWISGLHPSKRSMRRVNGFKLSVIVIQYFVLIGSVCLRHVLSCSSHHFWTFKFGVIPFFAPLLAGTQPYVSINLVFLEVSLALSLIEIIGFTVMIMSV